MGEAGGRVEGEERRGKRGRVSGRSSKKSEWAAALGSKRYFLSLFWKRFRRGL
jgi:hypothetical protein